MKTFMAKQEEVEQKWHIVDATGVRVGRMATQIANILRGKNKPTYTPHVDTGDFVIVINTDKIELTGSKWQSKKYFSHSRFFGSLKEKTAAQAKEEDSTFIVTEAVRGMLPTNKLSRHTIMKLKAYAGADHPHSAQNPQALNIRAGK
jgi:large subunit ribosomal protein L13